MNEITPASVKVGQNVRASANPPKSLPDEDEKIVQITKDLFRWVLTITAPGLVSLKKYGVDCFRDKIIWKIKIERGKVQIFRNPEKTRCFFDVEHTYPYTTLRKGKKQFVRAEPGKIATRPFVLGFLDDILIDAQPAVTPSREESKNEKTPSGNQRAVDAQPAVTSSREESKNEEMLSNNRGAPDEHTRKWMRNLMKISLVNSHYLKEIAINTSPNRGEIEHNQTVGILMSEGSSSTLGEDSLVETQGGFEEVSAENLPLEGRQKFFEERLRGLGLETTGEVFAMDDLSYARLQEKFDNAFKQRPENRQGLREQNLALLKLRLAAENENQPIRATDSDSSLDDDARGSLLLSDDESLSSSDNVGRPTLLCASLGGQTGTPSAMRNRSPSADSKRPHRELPSPIVRQTSTASKESSSDSLSKRRGALRRTHSTAPPRKEFRSPDADAKRYNPPKKSQSVRQMSLKVRLGNRSAELRQNTPSPRIVQKNQQMPKGAHRRAQSIAASRREVRFQSADSTRRSHSLKKPQKQKDKAAQPTLLLGRPRRKSCPQGQQHLGESARLRRTAQQQGKTKKK